VLRIQPYEVMLMIHPDAEEDRHREIIDRIRTTVTGGGGSWGEVDDWGRRKLAYEIDHQTDAFYYVLTFDASPETLDEITRVLRITDGVMRFMPVVRPQHPPQEPAEAAAASDSATA
jgi:small subunit ribosomal protein S6